MTDVNTLAQSVDIGASGFMGVGVEEEQGTYVPPEKFFPIRSESLAWQQDTVWRRVIRGTADVIGAVPGNGRVEGDVEMELLDDVLPYFLRAARGNLTKTGASAPFTYEFVPTSQPVPHATLSVTVVRNGEAFGYSGCAVASMSFGVDDGMASFTASLLGQEETPEDVPTPAYNPADMPFGAGTWTIQIPTSTTVWDSDNFSLEIEDGGAAQNRLIPRRGAAYISYGERNVTLSVDRDFTGRDQYDEFKNLTKQSITVQVEKSASARISFEVPTTVVDSYEVTLSGVGDLIRSSTTYMGTHSPTLGGSYKITIITPEDLTLPA